MRIRCGCFAAVPDDYWVLAPQRTATQPGLGYSGSAPPDRSDEPNVADLRSSAERCLNGRWLLRNAGIAAAFDIVGFSQAALASVIALMHPSRSRRLGCYPDSFPGGRIAGARPSAGGRAIFVAHGSADELVVWHSRQSVHLLEALAPP
jgi:hypothetical protein